MNQRFLYLLHIILFLVCCFSHTEALAFDGPVYVEETASRLAAITESNKLFVAAGKAEEGTYLFNKFKDTYQTDLIEVQDGVDINTKLSTFNGKVLAVLHAAYPVGTLGNKEAMAAVETYSSAIFSKLATSGTELGLINIWPVISSDGQSMSYQVNILQTASLNTEASTYLSGTKTSLGNTTLSLPNIINVLLERNETAGMAFTFNPEDLSFIEPTYTAAASSANTYLTQSCQYIQFTVPISGEQYDGIYLTSFLYEGKRYAYSYKPVIEKDGTAKTLSGIQRTASTAFLPFAEMKRLAQAGSTSGFQVEFYPDDKFVVTLDANSSWYFNSFTVKTCAEVSSFKTEEGTIDLTGTTCQEKIDNCNNTNGSGSGAGSAKIINKTKDQNIDLSSLMDLFNGKKAIASTEDPKRKSRTSKVIVFLSDKDTDQKDIDDFHKMPTPNGEIKLWLKKGEGGNWLVEEGVNETIINSIYSRGFGYGGSFSLNQSLTGKTYSLKDLATVTYLLADWISTGIGNLYIPETWWNCNSDEFNPPIFVQVVKIILAPTAQITDVCLRSVDPEFSSKYGAAADIQFAAMCGIWDGFVGLLDALPQAAKLASMSFADDPKAKQETELMSRMIDANGGGVWGFAGMMWQGVKSQFDVKKPCVLSHALGQVAFDVLVAVFTGGTAAAGSKAGSAIKIALTTLERLDILGKAIGKVAGASMRVAFKGTAQVLTISVKNGVKFIEATFAQTSYLIKVFDATKQVVKNLDWNDFALVREVTLVTLDGQQRKMTILQDPTQGIKNGIYKINEILRDEAGVPVRNAEGDYAASVEIRDPLNPNNPPTTDIIVVREVTRSLEEILVNGKIPANSKNNNLFHKWFDELTQQELELVLADPTLKEALEARIRYPGGLHEWCMVCEISKFKSWEIPMSEIHRFRTKTLDLTGINPVNGEVFIHGGAGSSAFHIELRALIQQSNSLLEFNEGLKILIERWKIDPNLLPPIIK